MSKDASNINKGRHSPVTVASLKTLTTKSMTIESSSFENNNIASFSQPSRLVNNNIKGYPVNTLNKPIISPNVISVEQYSESIERCSESSSLTDTSDWHHTSSGGNSNMFKDATKGSTFHKSKRIVRVGDSISESNEKDANTDGTAVMPSIKDRISQFKSGSTPSCKIYKSPGSSIKEEFVAPKSSYNVGSNAPPTHMRNRSGLPPQPPTSSPIFSVKLRKTKNSLNEMNGRDSDAVEESSAPASSSTNPFLSNVKLRSTTPSWMEKQGRQEIEPSTAAATDESNVKLRSTTPSWMEKQQGRQEVEPTTTADTDESQSPPPEAPPTRKLTYREQQELRKKEQQELTLSTTATKEEPKKDVATLIRERIAMNKQHTSVPPSPTNSVGSELDIGSLRGNLKKTWKQLEATTTSSSLPISPQHVVTPKTTVMHSPKEEDNNPKQALHSMLANRLGTPPIQHETKDPPSSDPRAALMAAIGSRVEKQEPSDPRGALMASIGKRAEDAPPADPRAALMASISKRATPLAQEEEEETVDPKANLAAMLQNRIAAAGGGGGPLSKSEAKSNLSGMLAMRSPPAEVKETVDTCSDGRPALKNDPKYEKYFKMLKGENAVLLKLELHHWAAH
jgi:hypothetical protein